ncbi:MAG: hypothetical protein ACTTJV_07020 [Ottowia sp.]
MTWALPFLAGRKKAAIVGDGPAARSLRFSGALLTFRYEKCSCQRSIYGPFRPFAFF